jgi:hypothetical protein
MLIIGRRAEFAWMLCVEPGDAAVYEITPESTVEKFSSLTHDVLSAEQEP